MTTLFLIFLGVVLIYLTFTGIDFRQSKKIIEGLGILILLIIFYVIFLKVCIKLNTYFNSSTKTTKTRIDRCDDCLDRESDQRIENYEML